MISGLLEATLFDFSSKPNRAASDVYRVLGELSPSVDD